MTARIDDIIEGSYRESDAGVTHERVFIVHEVGGPRAARQYLAATTSGVPRLGQPHPHIPGIVVTDVDVSPEERENSIFRVGATYGPPPSGSASNALGSTSFELVSQTISEETTQDIHGAFLTTKHLVSTSTLLNVGTASFSGNRDILVDKVERRQVHRVSIERPTFALRWDRVEASSGFANAVAFSSRVNATAFNDLPPQTVLMRISSSQIEEGKFRVSYEAIYNPRSWLAEITAADDDGRVPEGLNSVRTTTGLPQGNGPQTGGGIALHEMYPTADFNLLGLPPIP